MGEPNHPNEFAELFIRSQRRIYGYILTVVPEANEADDIFQETSLILWKKSTEFDSSADFVAWACGIARNVVRNRRVKQSRDRHIFSDAMLEHLAAVRESKSAWLEERTSLLSQCMSRLSGSQRELLRRFYGDNNSEDLAREQGVSLNSLYQRLHRIRRRLLDCVSRLQNAEGTQ